MHAQVIDILFHDIGLPIIILTSYMLIELLVKFLSLNWPQCKWTSNTQFQRFNHLLYFLVCTFRVSTAPIIIAV